MHNLNKSKCSLRTLRGCFYPLFVLIAIQREELVNKVSLCEMSFFLEYVVPENRHIPPMAGFFGFTLHPNQSL